jgi:hypothetical protein
MPALSEIRTPSYAPSARVQSISSGDGNSAENHFPISPRAAWYDRKLFPLVSMRPVRLQSKGRRRHAVLTKVCRPKDYIMEIVEIVKKRQMTPPIPSQTWKRT